jgi:DNA modification methylase
MPTKRTERPINERGANVPPIRCSFSKVVSVDALKPNPRNPNRHPEGQLELYVKAIAHQGWRRAVVVSKRSGFIVTGHGAVQAARRAGWPTVPVDYQDFASANDETAHMLADNRLPELAEMSESDLAVILSELKLADVDLEIAGFDSCALDAALSGLPGGEVDAEPQIDRAAELQKEWKTERGQIWELGEHRLMCGDSESDDVVLLLGQDKPHLMITDPPYGVSYDPQWRVEYDGSKRHALGKVENDGKVDWTKAYQLSPAEVCYVWHAGKYAREVASNLASAKFEIVSQIIWVKPHFVLSRGDYHWRHEPCWYACRKAGHHHWNGARDQDTVWEIQTRNGFIQEPGQERTGHGTQKPVECMAKPIENNSQRGDLVYEPFSGSGTTIIACERLGRRCRAMEISPGYVAVALQRFKDATGKTPVLL